MNFQSRRDGLLWNILACRAEFVFPLLAVRVQVFY